MADSLSFSFPPQSPESWIVSTRGICVQFGAQQVLRGVDLTLQRGEILGLVGASGCGKSVLMRAIVSLLPRTAGDVVFSFADFQDDGSVTYSLTDRLDAHRFGVLFQHGALFSSLSVIENIDVPLKEYTSLKADERRELAMLKLRLVGLADHAADKYPSELSGGMIKRAALARALALDPPLLFLDEPTAGLDPIGAQNFDELLRNLQQTLGLSVIMVTHDLDSLLMATDRISVLKDGVILTTDTFDAHRSFDDPWMNAYFNGARARAIVS